MGKKKKSGGRAAGGGGTDEEEWKGRLRKLLGVRGSEHNVWSDY